MINMLPSSMNVGSTLSAYFTVAFTYAFVQQHCPWPPWSSTRAMSMYSPGAENVTSVTALPPSRGGEALLKVTAPAPRNLDQSTVNPTAKRPLPPGRGLGTPSSVTQTVSGTGVPATALSDVIVPAGPWPAGPLSENLANGVMLSFGEVADVRSGGPVPLSGEIT